LSKLRDDERLMFRLLKPLLELRAAGSAVLIMIILAMTIFNYYVTWPMFGVFLVIIVAVNYFSFLFIDKGVPVKAFITMNGTLFTLIISLGVYYTGGGQSPLMLSYVLLIMMTAVLSNSVIITLVQTSLAIIAADTVILLDAYGVIETKPFFMNVGYSIYGEGSTFYTILLWNIFYLICGGLIGSISKVIGRVRSELHAANVENVRLQKIVRTLVSKHTWSEISQAAKNSQEKFRERRELHTIMFSDIVGFSSIAESIRPEEVVAMLNLHFQQMAEIIYQHGGDIDKFIGDCIMAVFEDAESALAAAMDMQLKIDENTRSPKRWDPQTRIKIRIGINTGEVVIGTMGTPERMDISLIGDAVNVAQRLESMAKPGFILVSDATFRKVRKSGYIFTSVGRVRIKGKKKMVRAYSINPLKHRTK